MRQTGPHELELLLGPGEAATAAVLERCRRLLADFGAAQGAAELKVATRSVDVLPLGCSGKLKRIVAAPGALR